ncbi:hypothetical protein jhhlp_004591 [Lomentospora prolificans]|uniref:Nonsense-mediated mRNA decay factor n=1 Tax=Lomentospora prolificans TaxID=41688 RepID=A0A2N3NC08_9PEZI|nr:hypothetical protein jhhlp_004591 [Lomentospora prolificans]
MASEAAADRAADVAGVWKHAQKIFKAIQKEANNLKRGSHGDISDAKWKSLEDAMSQYRLACVGILFQDPEFAQQNQVEKALWTSHILINNIYRNVSKRLPPDQKVKIRSVESRYNRFITTSQLFYKGYIQRLSMRYNIEPLHRIAAAVKVQRGPGQDCIPSITPEIQSMILLSVQETLTYLGDLSRYRAQLKPNSRDNEAAITYYSLAHDVVPDRGFALHQIGVTYLEADKHLEVVYYFFMSLARKTPHPNAEKNLEAKLKTIQAGKSAISGSQSMQQILEGRIVQLLAKYMTNATFPGRDELEQTVLARLEQFLQSEHSADSVVRMALVNMSAYYYAQKHHAQSLASAYTLSFNMQFLQAISRLMQGYLREAQGVMPGEMEPSASRLSQLHSISPGVDTAVRVLRLYCCWLSSHVEDLAQAPQAAQFLVQSAWKDFAQMATELITYCISDMEEFCKKNQLSFPPTAPYLLKEDEEAVCCLSIGDLSSDIYARLFHQDRTRVRKPTMLELGVEGANPLDEFVCRLGDVVDSIRRFSENPAVPLGIQTRSDGNWSLVYGYQVPAEPQEQPPLESQSSPLNSPVPNHEVVQRATPVTTEAYQQLQVPAMPVNDRAVPPSGTLDMQVSALSPSSPVDSLAVSTRGGTYSPLSWDWFHEPTPTGAWAGLTREVFENLPTGSTTGNRRPSSAVSGNGDQREMLLQMLRSASQGTGKASPSSIPAMSPRAQVRGDVHPGQADYAFPQGGPSVHYGASIDGIANGFAASVTSPPRDVGAAEQSNAYMLHRPSQMQQKQRQQQQQRRAPHAYRASLSQQVQQQMAAMQTLDPRDGGRPRSSRGNSGRGSRNHGDGSGQDGAHLLDLRKKTVTRIQRGMNGP